MHTITPQKASSGVSCNHCSLAELCLPHGLDQREMLELESSLERTLKLKKKAFLFQRDDPQQYIYAVKSGAVKTALPTPDGEEQIIGFYLPGDLLGFDALSKGKHTCNAQVLEDTHVCQLSIDAFHKLCGEMESLRTQMMRNMGSEIERENSLLLTLGQMRTESRLATFLIGMSERNQARGFSANEFHLSMPRHDLANYLGMAVETLSRMFSKLSDDGMIEVKHRLVKIIDNSNLRSLAHTKCT